MVNQGLKSLFNAAAICSVLFSSSAFANTTLDFEGPLPDGLQAVENYSQGSAVASQNMIGENYLSLGVSVTGAALVNLGIGHAASGQNGLTGVSSSSVDYGAAYSFDFYVSGNKNKAGVIDYFSITPDRGGNSGNTITLTAFDADNHVVGSKSFVENVIFLGALELNGIGSFHRVSVANSLNSPPGGGIGMDLVTYGNISPAAPVPEPETYAMLLAGLGLIGAAVKRRKAKQA